MSIPVICYQKGDDSNASGFVNVHSVTLNDENNTVGQQGRFDNEAYHTHCQVTTG